VAASNQLVNRGIDVVSASLRYIAVNIRHESSRFGIFGKFKITVLTEFSGNMASTLVKGDNESDAVETELRTAIDEFQATLSHLGHTAGFRTLELVTGIYPSS
jgi:hypothetical protein